jgi:hypothetical protein
MLACHSDVAEQLASLPDSRTPDTAPPPKLLDRVRTAVRVRHCSRRTEKAYVDWIRRYIVFHKKRYPSTMRAAEISAFLAWLAVERRVSASTQNQALCALVFLYRQVLGLDLGPIEHTPRARMPDKLPVVLSREEIGQLMKHVEGVMWLIVALLYGAGLRLEECRVACQGHRLRSPANRGASWQRTEGSGDDAACGRQGAAGRACGNGEAPA